MNQNVRVEPGGWYTSAAEQGLADLWCNVRGGGHLLAAPDEPGRLLSRFLFSRMDTQAANDV